MRKLISAIAISICCSHSLAAANAYNSHAAKNHNVKNNKITKKLNRHPPPLWRHELFLAYGMGQAYSENYDNSAVLLEGTLWQFNGTDRTLFFSINASMTYWHASTDKNKNNFTIAIAPSARAYFFSPASPHTLNPYLRFSCGPVYLAKNFLGDREQGSHFALQSLLGGGVEWQITPKHRIDINIGLMHICNAGLASPNQGFNINKMIGIGYQF